ncbi:MAG TPA: hypothetical protein PLZ16_05285, partial [Gammaproteobacteria bacterium]|nr:hypothetical protein [Gammaproteobacteria bacterium]
MRTQTKARTKMIHSQARSLSYTHPKQACRFSIPAIDSTRFISSRNILLISCLFIFLFNQYPKMAWEMLRTGKQQLAVSEFLPPMPAGR